MCDEDGDHSARIEEFMNAQIGGAVLRYIERSRADNWRTNDAIAQLVTRNFIRRLAKKLRHSTERRQGRLIS
jgi:hypothetical protein